MAPAGDTPGEARGESYDGAPILASLEYLRARVGVPRDMDFPAARQFRAHLTWMMDALEGQS